MASSASYFSSKSCASVTYTKGKRRRDVTCFLCSRPLSPRIRRPKTTPEQSLKQKQNVRLQTPTGTVKTNTTKTKTMIKANVPPPILEDLSPLETIKDSFDMIATSFATTVTIWSNNRFNKNRNPMSSLESEGMRLESEGGGNDDDGRKGGGGGNGDNNDDEGDWGEENDGYSEDSQFVWIRNGQDGLKWLVSFLVFSWYCFFFAHEPFWGCVWLTCAIGTGWGLFLVGSAVSGALFVINFFYRVYDSSTANVLSESKEKTGGVIDYGIGIKKEAIKMIQAERFRKTIPEPIENLQTAPVDRNLNPNLPKHVSLFGTDAQIVQMKLKPGESVNAEPGAMCYMSSNVLSITSLGPGGLSKAIARVLAGEPFFINTFRNLGSSDGYIALGSLRQGDKIAVVNLKEREADLLCARDSYLCSMGDISVSAAVSFSQEARGGRTLSQVLKQRFRTGVRLILSKGNNIFNGEWLVGDGTACITGKGTVMRRTLKEGEEMVVDARAVLALERTIEYDLELVSSPVAAVFGGEGLFHVRLKGPGGFYLQSLPIDKAKKKLRLGGRSI
ncbi:unnamed protein product [Bathycoccus prasinos]